MFRARAFVVIAIVGRAQSFVMGSVVSASASALLAFFLLGWSCRPVVQQLYNYAMDRVCLDTTYPSGSAFCVGFKFKLPLKSGRGCLGVRYVLPYIRSRFGLTADFHDIAPRVRSSHSFSVVFPDAGHSNV